MPARSRENLKIVAMVIARMGSSRVPGKSLMELEGKPVVAHMIRLARHMKNCHEVAVLTSQLPEDDVIAKLGEKAGVPVVRGHPEFVLDRIVKAINERGADIVVYVGGDCPLLDPAMLDDAIDKFFRLGCDYLNNYAPPTFPEGHDVNIITREAVMTCYENALAPSQRIHAFSYLTRHPGLCTIVNYTNGKDLSRHHWSLDFPEDFEFLRAVYSRLFCKDKAIATSDVLDLIASDPEIRALDQALQRAPVAHAFWNSPGMMRDMNNDLLELSKMAAQATRDDDKKLARNCYREITLISNELSRKLDYSL